MGAWLQLGDRTARALFQRWMADQIRQGPAAATISRRLASLTFLARQSALKELAEIRLHLLKAPRPERRRPHCQESCPLGAAFGYRDYLKGCDASAYLAAEQQAAQTRQGVWRWGDTVQRPWDFRQSR